MPSATFVLSSCFSLADSDSSSREISLLALDAIAACRGNGSVVDDFVLRQEAYMAVKIPVVAAFVVARGDFCVGRL